MGYRTLQQADQAIERLFRRRHVVQIGDLQKALGTFSRMTIWRHLRRHDYLTSFTHKGGFYTLRATPTFDENGLWFHQGVGFSTAGTLKETVADLVEIAEAGRTQRELRDLVLVRVQETLLTLINAERICRKKLPVEYLYLSADEARAAEQLARRKEILEARAAPTPPLPMQVVIEILLDVVRAARPRIDAAAVASRLESHGIHVSEEEVESTLKHYGITKKGAS